MKPNRYDNLIYNNQLGKAELLNKYMETTR